MMSYYDTSLADLKEVLAKLTTMFAETKFAVDDNAPIHEQLAASEMQVALIKEMQKSSVVGDHYLSALIEKLEDAEHAHLWTSLENMSDFVGRELTGAACPSMDWRKKNGRIAAEAFLVSGVMRGLDKHLKETARRLGVELDDKRLLPPSAPAGYTHPFTDDAMMELGRHCWDETYGKGMSDAQTRELLSTMGTSRKEAHPIQNFAAKWAHYAFQKLVTSHTYAAALMCSDAPRDVLQDLEISWKAFLVVVPDGIFDLHEEGIGTASLRRIAIAVYDWRAEMSIYDPGSAYGGKQILCDAKSLVDLLYMDASFEKSDINNGIDADRVQKIVVMAKRLVVGLLLAYANSADHKTRVSGGNGHGNKSGRTGEPKHRITFIGKPLKVDCRPAVERYLSGAKGKAPSMQTLVRGHHKRQVVGVARVGRKVIWVEPYWRGPEDAPILTRPKLLN